MEQQPSKQPSKNSKGYGKRPLWQWILIYVVAAIIIYGLVYVLFFHKSGGGTGGGLNY